MALLENEHIRLRALEPEDLANIYLWENNTEWWGVGNTLTPYSRYVLKEYIAQSHRDLYDLKQLRLVIERKESPTPIGTVDLYDFDPHNRRVGVGVLIDPACQGNGIATEAMDLLKEYVFSFLKLHQLYVYVAENNDASRTLFARCGFETTGKLADWQVAVDGYRDVLVMQLLNPQGR